jgi:hypothetical protein
MNSSELADRLENATNISEVARLTKEEVIPMLRATTLTDEEINTEMLAYLNSKTMGLEDFAKAILRKAQEK